MQTLNYFTNSVGSPGHNARPHARLPPSFLGMDAWMHSNLITKRRFYSQATQVIGVHGFFGGVGHVIHGCLHNQALADVWSTGNTGCTVPPTTIVWSFEDGRCIGNRPQQGKGVSSAQCINRILL